MAVFIINNMTIHDPAEYRIYVKAFMPISERAGGKVLAVKDAPVPLEGQWPFDRTVLLEFPSRDAMERWVNSPEYQAIARHRHAATASNVLVLDGLE
jgi:uncharacterized protein (DUF1330 family)